jgi:rubredoxin
MVKAGSAKVSGARKTAIPGERRTVPKKNAAANPSVSTKKSAAPKKIVAAKKTANGTKVPANKTAAAKKRVPSKKNSSATQMRYRCRICGYIYSPLRGEPHNGIPTGTAFDDLPGDYVCPICGADGKGRIGKWGFEEWRPTRYLCSMCDYIYDEKRGEPHRGIKAGTKFEDLPDNYVCPICAAEPKIVKRYGNVIKAGFYPLYE